LSLHSFPTRRSSDLRLPGIRWLATLLLGGLHAIETQYRAVAAIKQQVSGNRQQRQQRCRGRGRDNPANQFSESPSPVGRSKLFRSEEHTSELQSREN